MMPNPPKIKKVSPEELEKLQEKFKEEDLKRRDENVKLEDIMIFRGKGARMIRSENIDFDEDE